LWEVKQHAASGWKEQRSRAPIDPVVNLVWIKIKMFIVHTDQFVCIFIFFIDMGKIKKSGEIWENMYFGRGKSTLECALIFPKKVCPESCGRNLHAFYFIFPISPRFWNFWNFWKAGGRFTLETANLRA
jgi:hypothetical protein